MPGRVYAHILGELTQSKVRGKELVKALGEKLKPSAIANYVCKKGKK